MTNQELKTAVTDAVKKRQEEGFLFVRSVYFSVHYLTGGYCGCLVGATLNRKPDHRKYRFAESELAAELGATEDQVFSMEAGFCGWSRSEICGHGHKVDEEMYSFGATIASKMLQLR